MFFDSEGILGQVQSDGSIEGGDSANWMGHLVYLTNSKTDYTYLFEVGFGAYVRHPNPASTNHGFGAYYKDPWNGVISRDQLTGIIAALIAQKRYGAMLRLMGHHAARLFLFSYNTIHNGVAPATARWKMPDLTLFDIWALELRGFGYLSWLFWPILLVFDIHLLLNTLFKLGKKQDDPISFAMKLIICKEHVPTLTSLLAWIICDREKLYKDIADYWGGWRASPDMTILYKPRLLPR